jgi:hypothetical protein
VVAVLFLRKPAAEEVKPATAPVVLPGS